MTEKISEHYIPRSMGGYMVPYLPPGCRRYFAPKFVEWCDTRGCDIFSLMESPDLSPSGTPTVPWSIPKYVGKQLLGLDNGWEFMSRLKVVSGQLKNFFVALWTIRQCPVSSIRVGIIGSSAAYGSGRWLSLLPNVMLMLGYTGIVHAYDNGLESSVRQYDRGDLSIVYSNIKSYYTGDGKEYDVIIDDTFFAGQPGRNQWKSRYWSIKDQSPQARPFFHLSEGRKFSHSDYPEWTSVGCPCPRCVLESYFPPLLKSWTLNVENSMCQFGDMNAKAAKWAEFETYSVVRYINEVEKRAVLSITADEQVASVHRGVERSTERRITFKDGELAGRSVGELEEKSAFVGIDPVRVGYEGRMDKENQFSHVYDSVYTVAVGGVCGLRYYVPPELKPVGFVPTGVVRHGLLGYKQIFSPPPAPDVVYDGTVSEREDAWGGKYLQPTAEVYDKQKIWCPIEQKVVMSPHTCQPYATIPIIPGNPDGIVNGWFVRGCPPYTLQDRYCPYCHVVACDHKCNKIRRDSPLFYEGIVKRQRELVSSLSSVSGKHKARKRKRVKDELVELEARLQSLSSDWLSSASSSASALRPVNLDEPYNPGSGLG